MGIRPSCPIRPGFLDSADYWTDDALLSAVLPLSAEETHRMAVALHRNEEDSDRSSRSELSRRAIADWFQPSVSFRWHSSAFFKIFCASSLVQQTWALS